MREEVFARQKALGWIPANTELTPRDPTMPAWADIPEAERPFQLRLMELYAGFVEHTDAQVGKLVDFLDQTGQRDNTIILYIWGDNGSSAEGQNGSISELLAQNQIPNTIAQQIKALDELGGLKALGGPLTDNMYHAGWAWAGSTPFRSTKLVAAHFGGTRNPLVVSWPKKIKPDKTPRSQFYHVNDIAPTLYDVIGIKAPKEVNGFKQDPIDGVSMAAQFHRREGPGKQARPVFRQQRQRRDLSGRLVCLHLRPAVPVAQRPAGTRQVGFQQGRVGTLRSHQGLLPDARPRQGDSRRNSRK